MALWHYGLRNKKWRGWMDGWMDGWMEEVDTPETVATTRASAVLK